MLFYLHADFANASGNTSIVALYMVTLQVWQSLVMLMKKAPIRRPRPFLAHDGESAGCGSGTAHRVDQVC